MKWIERLKGLFTKKDHIPTFFDGAVLVNYRGGQNMKCERCREREATIEVQTGIAVDADTGKHIVEAINAYETKSRKPRKKADDETN